MSLLKFTPDPEVDLRVAQERLSAEQRVRADLTSKLDAALEAEFTGSGTTAATLAVSREIDGVDARIDSLRRLVSKAERLLEDHQARQSVKDAAAALQRASEVAKRREKVAEKVDAALADLARHLADLRALGEEFYGTAPRQGQYADTLFAPPRVVSLIRMHLGTMGLAPDVRFDRSASPPSIADESRRAHAFHLNTGAARGEAA